MLRCVGNVSRGLQTDKHFAELYRWTLKIERETYMNKTWAMKWAKALESGRYKQGRQRLKDADNRYCCLGVLCRIARAPERAPGIFDDEEYHLPDSVVAKVGMSSNDGRFLNRVFVPQEGTLVLSLTNANDAHGYTFEEIAGIIRKRWRTL